METKRHRITLHENIDKQKFDWADYRADFTQEYMNSYEEFKEWLIENGIGRVELRYIDVDAKKPRSFSQEIETEFFFRDHFTWLTTFDWGKYKFIELTSIDKHVQLRMAV